MAIPLPEHTARWSLTELRGRLAEITSGPGGASLSVAMDLVASAQRAGETVAWISARPSSFFPPDAAAAGVDLPALAVVRVRGAQAAGRAADKLLRSNGFGLLVLDLDVAGGKLRAALTVAHQARLLALAQKHSASVLFLVEKHAGASSLGSLISLRVEARRRRTADGRFVCELVALKDKRHASGWTHGEAFDGPAGVR